MQESPAFVLPFVLLVSAGVLVLISRYSGWNLLSEHYPGDRAFPPPSKWLGYGVFRGWVGYNGGIVVASDSQGLYLRAMPIILSFCHRRIFIPWSDVVGIEKRTHWARQVLAIRTRRAAEVDFALRPSTFAVVRDDALSAGVPGDY